MLTLELIKNILDSKKDASAEYIYEKLKTAEDISRSIRLLNKEKEIEKDKYTQKLKEIDLKIKSVREKCDHWSKTYNPDPSGNNDSYYSCNICDKEL